MNIYNSTLQEYSPKVLHLTLTFPPVVPCSNPYRQLQLSNCLHPVNILIPSNRSYIYIYIPKYRIPRISTYLNTLLHYLIHLVTIRITSPYTFL